MKRDAPPSSTGALLNAQPMGFYAPATIVEDARRHGVIVRPVDVQASAWDCTLERCPESSGGFAVRMGLRYVKGLGDGDWKRIEAARRAAPVGSLAGFVRRAGLDAGALRAQGLPDARTVALRPNGARVRYAGLVICRQRPASARNVVFTTLEDETGLVSVVLWERVFERYAVLAKTADFLGVTGTLQIEQGVVHIVAERLWAPPARHALARVVSRDFR